MNEEEIKRRIIKNSERLEAESRKHVADVTWKEKLHVIRDFFKKKDKETYRRYKKWPRVVRRAFLFGIVAASLVKGGQYLSGILSEKAVQEVTASPEEDPRKKEIERIERHNEDVKNRLETRYTISDRESFDRLFEEALPLVQVSLFSVECCAFEPYSDNNTGVLNTVGMGNFYYPEDGNPESSKWIRTSSYIRKNGLFKVDMKETFDLSRGWFVHLGDGAVLNQMYDLLKGAELNSHEEAALCLLRYGNKPVGTDVCRFVRRNYQDPEKCARHIALRSAPAGFPGISKRYALAACLYLNKGDFVQQLYQLGTKKVKLKRGGEAYSAFVNNMTQQDVQSIKRAINSGNEALIIETQNKIMNRISNGDLTICGAICKEIGDEDYCQNILRYQYKDTTIVLADAMDLLSNSNVDEQVKENNSDDLLMEKALASYQKGVKLKQRDKNGKAKVELTKALGSFARLLETDEDNADLRNRLASTYYQLGEYEKCIDESAKVLAAADKKACATANINMALAHTQLGHAKEAIDHYQEAISNGADKQSCTQAINNLKSSSIRLAYVSRKGR